MTTIARADTGVPPASAITSSAEARGLMEWRPLLRIGAVAAFCVIAFVPIQLAVLLIWPIPTSVLGWFSRLQENAVAGLLDMDVLMLADYVFFAALFLALFVALRKSRPSLAALMLVVELIAVAVYLGSNHAFEMLAASTQYSSATSDAERSSALAVGQAMLWSWQGTAFSTSYVLAGIAQLLAGIAMLGGATFGRITAYAGIVAGVAALVPPTAGTIGLTLSLISLLPMWVWLALTGRRLLQLARMSA